MKNLQKQLIELKNNNVSSSCLIREFVKIHPDLEQKDLINKTWIEKINTKFSLYNYIKSIILTDKQFSVNNYITYKQWSWNKRYRNDSTYIYDLQKNEMVKDLPINPSLHMLNKAYDENRNLKWNGKRWILGDLNYQPKFNIIKNNIKRSIEIGNPYTDEDISINLYRMNIPQTEKNINNCK